MTCYIQRSPAIFRDKKSAIPNCRVVFNWAWHLNSNNNFIFYFLGGSTRVCQPRTTNKSHWISGNNAGACTTLHYLASWSHLEMWWGVRLEKSLTLNVISASVKADGLDAWLPQKQPNLGLLIFREKLYRLALFTTLKAKRHRCWNTRSLVNNNDKRSKTRDQVGDKDGVQIRRF